MSNAHTTTAAHTIHNMAQAILFRTPEEVGHYADLQGWARAIVRLNSAEDYTLIDDLDAEYLRDLYKRHNTRDLRARQCPTLTI